MKKNKLPHFWDKYGKHKGIKLKKVKMSHSTTMVATYNNVYSPQNPNSFQQDVMNDPHNLTDLEWIEEFNRRGPRVSPNMNYIRQIYQFAADVYSPHDRITFQHDIISNIEERLQSQDEITLTWYGDAPNIDTLRPQLLNHEILIASYETTAGMNQIVHTTVTVRRGPNFHPIGITVSNTSNQPILRGSHPENILTMDDEGQTAANDVNQASIQMARALQSSPVRFPGYSIRMSPEGYEALRANSQTEQDNIYAKYRQKENAWIQTNCADCRWKRGDNCSYNNHPYNSDFDLSLRYIVSTRGIKQPICPNQKIVPCKLCRYYMQKYMLETSNIKVNEYEIKL